MSQPAPSRSPVRTAMALALACCLLAAAAGAQKIKMATLSPEGSPWDTILKKMGEQWEQGTGGRVGLTIYPGGVAGDEPDIIRKMKIGQYQAAALSVAGLADIDEYFTVFEIPLFFDSYPEMRSVLETLTPTLTGRLEAKGFQLLGWGYVGWVYFFTAKPVTALEDLQALKIFTWAGDETMVRWWRRNGFRPVSLSATDILTGLETGMIEAISVPPLYAMQMQYYKQAPYMADLGLAPMMGAIVMSKRGFEADLGSRSEGGAGGRAGGFHQGARADSQARRDRGQVDAEPRARGHPGARQPALQGVARGGGAVSPATCAERSCRSRCSTRRWRRATRTARSTGEGRPE
jgi:TRAP-type transport system periplasmic protein